MTNMIRTEPSPQQPLLTRTEILDIAKKLADERNWPVILALAVVECRLDADRRYREADLAYSLLDDEITRSTIGQEEENKNNENEELRANDAW